MNPPVIPAHEAHLSALGALLEASFPDPAVFFDDGLALLVQQLKLDCALIVRRGELGSEITWCHCEREDVREALGQELIDVLSQAALSHPQRTLVIQNLHAHKGAYLANVDPSPCIQSFAETVLWQDGQPSAVLMVMGHEPRHFLRHELALLVAVGDLFARTLEVENLKYELRVTRDALDLATAIVEDSAFESAVSGLPNAHYLGIWLRVNLYLARRRHEIMAVVGWNQELTPVLLEPLRELAETLRGEDLLVDLGQGGFLLLMPHTDQEGAQRPLERLRAVTGQVPMGATLWDPKQAEDRDDASFVATRTRVHAALVESRGTLVNREARVCWHMRPATAPNEADSVVRPA